MGVSKRANMYYHGLDIQDKETAKILKSFLAKPIIKEHQHRYKSRLYLLGLPPEHPS